MAKSSISVLMEYLVANRLPQPVYDDLAKTGPDHKPTFRMRVSADGYQSEGEGYTKQEAKNAACKKILDLMNVNMNFKKVKVAEKKPVEVAQQLQVGNTIGDLVQFCQRHHFAEPIYEKISEEGPDHMKTFTYQCSLYNMTEIGRGMSHQNAKKNAALKLLEKLQNEMRSNNNNLVRRWQVKDLATAANQAVQSYQEIKERTTMVENTTLKDMHKLYEKLPEKSPTLSRYIKNQVIPDADPVDLVTKIAVDLGVRLKVRDMARSALKDQLNLSVILMQLGTTPPLSSLKRNEREAAIDLLDTLVIMCTV